MTASAYGWKRNTPDRTPLAEGDVDEYKGHQLRAIAGIFGEQYVWQCRACGIERTSTKYIDDECPDN